MRKLSLVVLALGATLATGANAATVFTTGAPGAGTGGNETTAWIQANFFSLGAATTINGGGVYIGTFTGNLSGWDGTFDYSIYADSAGAPGASLASGAATNLATADTGIAWCCGGNLQLITFDIADFNAAAGTTYWLGIHLSTDFDRDEIYWAGDFPGNHSESLGGTENNWDSFGPRHGFFLTGDGVVIPEPATWAMMIAGFGLVGAAARRRRIAATT